MSTAAVPSMVAQNDQRPNDERIHRHPYRTAPVGVAAEHAGVRLGRQVLNLVLVTADVKHKRMFEVIARHRAYAVGSEKLVFVEHVGEHRPHQLRRHE